MKLCACVLPGASMYRVLAIRSTPMAIPERRSSSSVRIAMQVGRQPQLSRRSRKLPRPWMLRVTPGRHLISGLSVLHLHLIYRAARQRLCLLSVVPVVGSPTSKSNANRDFCFAPGHATAGVPERVSDCSVPAAQLNSVESPVALLRTSSGGADGNRCMSTVEAAK